MECFARKESLSGQENTQLTPNELSSTSHFLGIIEAEGRSLGVVQAQADVDQKLVEGLAHLLTLKEDPCNPLLVDSYVPEDFGYTCRPTDNGIVVALLGAIREKPVLTITPSVDGQTALAQSRIERALIMIGLDRMRVPGQESFLAKSATGLHPRLA